MTTEQLAARAKTERLVAGLTQEELGERLGVTQGAISQAERRRDDPSMNSLR
ncbi:MAG TPA: helix-turn-helix transcriptional regulator, partial [Chloroflexota bacterium]|nr:helix-turn-helix transcriptional regulator [Chloroflexota bacterium]